MIEKARRKYRQEGLGPLLREGPPFLGHRLVRRATIAAIRRASIHEDTVRASIDSVSEHPVALRESMPAALGGRVWPYGMETSIEVKPPYTGRVPDAFSHLIGTQSSPRPYVLELPRARLVGPYAIPQTADGKVIFGELGTPMAAYSRFRDTCDALGTVRAARELLLGGSGTHTAPEYDSIINLVPRHGTSYDHINYGAWFFEDLPRLRALEQESCPPAKLLIHPDPPDWVIESLRLMGYSETDWVRWTGDVATAETLILPKLYLIHSFGSEFDPEGRRWVRDRLKAGVDTSGTTDASARLFVSRQGQQRRRIHNIEAVMDALRPLGFESIRPETFSMTELIQLYDDAEIILGPHGSGMADMMYATDATVIEIFPKNEVRPVFYITANEFGHEYEYIEGENPPGITYKPTRNKDILVDIEELETVVGQAIDGPGGGQSGTDS